MFKLSSTTSPLRSGLTVVALAVGLFVLSGCSPNKWGFPYKVGVQQGNWITKDQVALLRPGMTREQVRFALGTPTLTSALHANRWELFGASNRFTTTEHRQQAVSGFTRDVLPGFFDGRIVPVVDSVFEFDQLPLARDRMLGNAQVGKIILRAP